MKHNPLPGDLTFHCNYSQLIEKDIESEQQGLEVKSHAKFSSSHCHIPEFEGKVPVIGE